MFFRLCADQLDEIRLKNGRLLGGQFPYKLLRIVVIQVRQEIIKGVRTMKADNPELRRGLTLPIPETTASALANKTKRIRLGLKFAAVDTHRSTALRLQEQAVKFLHMPVNRCTLLRRDTNGEIQPGGGYCLAFFGPSTNFLSFALHAMDQSSDDLLFISYAKYRLQGKPSSIISVHFLAENLDSPPRNNVTVVFFVAP